jgi:hypothetical protein
VIRSLRPKRSAGFDLISNAITKATVTIISLPLAYLIDWSFREGRCQAA